MNANRVSQQGTSTLDDNSIRRIKDGVSRAGEKRASKHQKTASIKKIAQKVSNDDNTTKRIVVASLTDIPSQFERIGTGFFREGHHLWEMVPGEGGFVLTRKHGEDHVLGYDPEPIKKESSVAVTDRFGVELKVGCKVRLPVHGKVATGTVLVLTPGSLDVGLDGGGKTSTPPGMTEFLEEEHEEHEEHGVEGDKGAAGPTLEEFIEQEEDEDTDHTPQGLEGVEEFVEQEMREGGGDKEAGDVFEPEISDKPKSDYVGPTGSQTGGIGGVASGSADDERHIAKAAQTDTPTQTITTQPTPAAPAEPGMPTYEPGLPGKLGQALEHYGTVSVYSSDMKRTYLVTKSGDKYDVRMEKLERLGLWDEAGLRRFEESLGNYEVQPMTEHVAVMIRQAMVVVDDMAEGMREWNEYWKSVGVRVAQASPKSKKAPKPKKTKEELAQSRKERRKQRELERAGLPKGTKLPPKPKMGAKDTDELAKLKEVVRMYEQNVDELDYTIQNIDPEAPNADVLAVDAVEVFLHNIEEEKERMEGEEEGEREEELSLETPSDLELGVQASKAGRIVVSMTDL